MDVQLWIELVPTDLKGWPTGPARRLPGRSWVRNMAVQMRVRLGDTTENGIDTSGGARTMITGLSPARTFSLQLVPLPAGAGVAGRGIVVGTGTTAPSTNDFNLAATISHGTGAGQLLHQDDVMHPMQTIAGGFRVFHERLFLNQSGGPITINEAGWIAFANVAPSAASFLFARDLISPGVVVANGSGIIVKYFEEWTV